MRRPRRLKMKRHTSVKAYKSAKFLHFKRVIVPGWIREKAKEVAIEMDKMIMSMMSTGAPILFGRTTFDQEGN